MTLSDDVLGALRTVLETAQKTGKSPLSALIDVQQNLPAGTAVTIDFSAQATLGHPLLIVDQSAPPAPAWWTQLSEREQEVALLVAQGLSNQKIAERLFIALSTVKDHVHHILDKSGKKRRTEVAHALARQTWPAQRG